MITIKQIKAVDTYQLRLEVLKTCAAYQYKYQGDFNTNTIHFGAFKNEILIGIVSLMKTENNSFTEKNQMQLRGMAVSKKHQANNIGNFLVKECYTYCKANKIDVIWCNARELATEFYKKQGFITKCNSFYIKNVGIHFLMHLSI